MEDLKVESYLYEMKFNFEKSKEQPWSEFRESPHKAGIYAIKNNDTIVYIGETKDIHSRLTHHHNRNGSALMDKIEESSKVPAEQYMENCTYKCLLVKLGRLEVEEFLIKQYDPLFNNYKLRKRYNRERS